MSWIGSYFQNRKKEICPNCRRTVRHGQLLLVSGKACCEVCREKAEKSVRPAPSPADPEPAKETAKPEKKAEPARRPAVQAAPVITERRNGYVHQYSVYSVTCSACGKTVSCRSDDIPRKYEDFEGARYCRACWEKKEKEITEPCPGCGKPVSRYDHRMNGRKGYCTACWDRHMIGVRERFGRYEKLLLDFLAGRGVSAAGSGREGLLPSGKPAGYVGFEERDHDMIRLRQSEYAAADFRIGKGWFALPESGSHLRYIVPSPDGKLMEFLAGIRETVLAAAVWSGNAAFLLEDGTVRSTDPSVDGAEAFDKEAMIRETAERILGEEAIRKSREAFSSPGIHSIADRLFYDGEKKAFFSIVTDGNYYHGYDVYYPVKTKDEVLRTLVRYEWLLPTEENCEKGIVPASVIAEGLEDAGDPNYSPPEGFGYGEYYI